MRTGIQLRSPTVRNTAAYGLSEACWGLAWSLSFEAPMVAAFAGTVGRGEADVGWIWLLFGVGLCVPMLFTDWVLASFRRKATLIAWGHAGAAVSLLLLGVFAHLLSADTLRLVHFAVVFVFALLIGIQAPAWFGLVGDLFAPGQQARVLGLAFVLNRLGALTGGAFATRALAAHDPWGAIYMVAGSAALIGCVPYVLFVEPAQRARRRPQLRLHFARVARLWQRSAPLRRFVIADCMGMAHVILVAHFAAAAFARDGHPEVLAGAFTQSMAVGMLLVSLLVAWSGGRMSVRGGLLLSIVLAIVGSVGASVGGSVALYLGVAFCVGGIGGLRMACVTTALMPLVTPRKRTLALGIHGTLVTALLGILPLPAGWLAPSVGYPAVFAAAAGLSVVAAGLFLHWVPHRRQVMAE